MTQATAIELDLQVKRAIEFNAGMMGSMLDAIGHQTLLAPYISDYRVIVVSPGTAMIEVDLLVRWDVSQTIRLPLTACIEEIEASLAVVRGRLEGVLASLDELVERRELIRTEASKLMSLARKQGIGFRITTVELAWIDAERSDRTGEMDLFYEAAACNMLRSFRERLSISSVAEARDELKALLAELRPAAKRANLAEAKGAVGFIEADSLEQLRSVAGDLQAALTQIARSLETRFWSEDRVCKAFGWENGVVYSEDHRPDNWRMNSSFSSSLTADPSPNRERLVAFTADGRMLS